MQNKSFYRFLKLFVAAMLALTPFSLKSQPEITSVDTTKISNWVISDLAGGKPEGGELSYSNNTAAFHYRRGRVSALAAPVLLTEFSEIHLSVQSAVDCILVLIVKDRDGAIFHVPFHAPARRNTEVTIKPSQFEINEDSPVKKKILDPKRLGALFVLLDFGVATHASGENTLLVSNAYVTYEPLHKESGNLIIDKPVRISESTFHEGNIIIKPGGQLIITSPRYVLNGNLQAANGAVEISGGTFVMPQKFNHQRFLLFQGSGRLAVRDASFVSFFPVSLVLQDTSSFLANHVDFLGGVTASLSEKSKVVLDSASYPGEFILTPGAQVSIQGSDSVVLWFPVGSNVKGKLSFPQGEKIDRWESSYGVNASIRDSTNITWCIISQPGSDALLEGGNVYAAGIYFAASTKAALHDLHNKTPAETYSLEASDRKLTFVNSKISAWNFYANEKANLRIDRCTFGESMAFGKSKIDIRDSVCDGSGGYIAAQDSSFIRLKNCKINSLVVASDRSTIILENCEVNGDVHAVGNSTVKLLHTRVAGHVEKESGATLIR